MVERVTWTGRARETRQCNASHDIKRPKEGFGAVTFMKSAALPANESERIAALHSYEILDTACEDLFDNVAHLAATLLGTPISLISLIDTDRQWFKSHIGLDATETPRDWAFCAHAILDQETVLVVPDARLDERFADNPLVVDEPVIRFYAGAPLVTPEGMALGTLCVIDQAPREMNEEQVLLLQRLAQTAVTTLELRRAMNRARDFALIDIMTGLPNRAALIAALDRAIARHKRHHGEFSLVYFDLDGFKRVNDLGGHADGDRVLREVAALLNATCREDDFAGRLGGDEFAMVLWGGETEALAAAERIRGEIERHMLDKGWAVTASIGAATFAAAPASPDVALMAADALMYAAKTAGKNQVRHQTFA